MQSHEISEVLYKLKRHFAVVVKLYKVLTVVVDIFAMDQLVARNAMLTAFSE